MIPNSIFNLFSKVFKHGFFRSVQMAIPRLRRIFNYYHNLFNLIFISNPSRKRILGIWDYRALPWSVGDSLIFVEKLSILKIEHKAEEVDICIVYDRANPGGMRGDRNLTRENAQDYIVQYLPLFGTCPYLGSIFQFSSRKEFYRFLKGSIDRYEYFPPLSQHLSESYNYIGGSSDVNDIQAFFKKLGYIPHLRIGKIEDSWAKQFYLDYLPLGALPVALSLRQPFSGKNDGRNANLSVWLAFIDKCKVIFPEIMFVIVGLREEVSDAIRKRANIIVAKDYGTSLIEDCALIRASLFYMATASGINAIANYSELPYLVFQYPKDALNQYNLSAEEIFPFVKGKQKIVEDDTIITTDLLFNEFQKLYLTLNRDEWLTNAKRDAAEKRGAPSSIALRENKARCFSSYGEGDI